TLAVAIRAPEGDIRQKLHFDMLETSSATGRAAAVSAIEAEGAGGVTALFGQGGMGEKLTNRVESTDVPGGVRARCLADGCLDHGVISAERSAGEQPVVLARCIGRAPLLLQPRRVEDVLDQRGLARTRETGNTHQPPKRYGDRKVLPVVGSDRFKRRLRWPA